MPRAQTLETSADFHLCQGIHTTMLKKTLTAVAIAALALSAHAADVLKVAATAVPHAEILNFMKPQLKAQGLDLEVKEFSDYVQPNAAVEDKQLDANFFQHQPYLDSYNKDRKSSLVPCPTARSTWSPSVPTPPRSRTSRT
jgi:D-methionine transport system substrate-binding protein